MRVAVHPPSARAAFGLSIILSIGIIPRLVSWLLRYVVICDSKVVLFYEDKDIAVGYVSSLLISHYQLCFDAGLC